MPMHPLSALLPFLLTVFHVTNNGNSSVLARSAPLPSPDERFPKEEKSDNRDDELGLAGTIDELDELFAPRDVADEDDGVDTG